MKYLLMKSQQGKYYFRDEAGDIVMVNESLQPIWDDIDEVTIGSYEVTQDKDGNKLEKPRQQKSVVAYTSEIKDLSKQKKLENLRLDNTAELDLRKLKIQAEQAKVKAMLEAK